MNDVLEPLVSIALPVYNGEQLLQAAIDGILAQTYRNFELIICDNASTDSTPEIIARAQAADDRIRVYRHERNIGPQANFRFGMEQRRGKYFMWAAHDDEKLAEYLSVTVAALERNPAASMACTWTTLITKDGERVHRPYSPAIASERLDERLAAFVADTQCVAFYGLYRSSVLERTGAPEDWLDADRHYLFKTIVQGPFEVVPRALFRFRMFNTLEDYLRSFRMRPGAADYDLDLYDYFPRLMREAGIDEAAVRRAREAMLVPLRPYFENRATFLIGQLLATGQGRRKKLARLAALAKAYPPLLQRRLFWGAVRRVIL
jgi:glycosyltransferase involved in cell wall biosynthesis